MGKQIAGKQIAGKHIWSRRVATIALLALCGTVLAVAGPPPAPIAAEANEAPGAPAAYRSLAVGGTHTCAIVNSGRVKCWGNNTNGRLGLGDTAARGDNPGEMGANLPSVDLGFGRTATAIAAGGAHTCALLDNATVKCWGSNAGGRLGLGDTNHRGDAAGEMGDGLPVVSLGTGRTALAISAGTNHTCAVLDNSTVKCWGANSSGQLGLGDTNARGDNIGEMGNALPAVNLGTGRTATAITAGNAFTCALLDNAAVKCWGANVSGRLGLGDTNARGDNAGEMGNALPAVALGTGRTALAISNSEAHTCALLDNATVKCWGANGSGRLGLGDTNARGDNANEMGDNLPAIDLGAGRSATAMTAGAAHTCALLDNTTVKCWGAAANGQIGLGGTNARGDNANEMGDNLPAVALGTGRTAHAVTVGGDHTCARLDHAEVKCWGANGSGQLGLGNTVNRGDNAGEMGDNLPAIDLSPGRSAAMLAAGGEHTCAIIDGGLVKCWGANTTGALGLGDTNARGDNANEMADTLPPVPLGTGRTATVITAGANHNCAILDNATVKCWGSNSHGQLGLGDTNHRGDNPGEMGDNLPTVSLGTGRTATAITAGSFHSCALLDNATVKCWGFGASGQLGLGNPDSRGSLPNQMGDNLPAVNLGTGRTPTAIAAGGSHNCAILDNATVKCWGSNVSGRLGLGDTNARGDNAGEMGDNLPTVDLGTGRTATSLAAFSQTCAVLDNATVKCWGLNGQGRLGLGDTNSRGDNPGEMGDNLPAVSLGTGRTAVRVSAGGVHTCAVLDNATVKCWGQGGDGQLGLGDTTMRGDNPGEMGDNLPAVSLGTGRTAVAAAAGSRVTCATLDNLTVKCWGQNTTGNLGLGDTTSRGSGPGQMGDALPVVQLGSANPLGVSGTVTATGPGAPVPGALVAVLRATDFTPAGGVVADLAGNYVAQVPPGSYYVYAIDPRGGHTPGFFGPTVIEVTTPGLVDADPTLTPSPTGSITGKVNSSATGEPIPGAWAIALSGTTGAPGPATLTDGGGIYAFDGLAPGSYFVGWFDPSGNHASRFSPNAPNVPDATPVAVTDGGETEAPGLLPPQTSTPNGGAALKGTVTQTGTGTPLADVVVIAMHAANFRLARADTTDSTGSYELDVTPGSYKLVFLDTTGRHLMEWHDNQPSSQIGDAANVTAPAVTDAALDRNTGTITGTLTDDETGAPLPGAWAFAIGPTGKLTGTVTNANGTYTITGLPPGTYRATFVDPVGGRAQEYWNNSPDYFGGTNINVTAGATTPNINAGLSPP